MYMRGLKKMAERAKLKLKKVGKFLDNQFVEPQRNYKKIQQELDDERRRKAESGEYNM